MVKTTKTQKRSTIFKRTAKKKAKQASTAVHQIGYSSGVSLWPTKYRAKLRYKLTHTLTAAAPDIWNDINFQTNSVFDPYVPAGGGNPKGYTDLKQHYAHYIVLGCKVTVHATLRAGNATYIALSNTEDTTHTAIYLRDDRLNDERTKYIELSNDKTQGTVSSYYSKSKVYGNNKNSELSAPFTANPTEGYFALIGSMNVGPGLATSTVDLLITLEYYVEAFEKLDTANA